MISITTNMLKVIDMFELPIKMTFKIGSHKNYLEAAYRVLHTPLTRTLPVGLADSYASMRIEVGSAYTLVFLAVILPVLWALQALATTMQKRYGT